MMRLCVQDVIFHVQWDDAGLAGGVHAVLDYFAFSRHSPTSSSSSEPPDVRLRFSERDTPLAVPEEARRLTTSHDGLQFYRYEERVFIEMGNAVVRLHTRDGKALGTLPAGLEEDQRTAVLFCLFFYSAMVLLYHRGLPTMHGACLCRDDGAGGSLLLGESGSGKSTLALNMVRQGWNYLSDDTVLLHESEGQIDVFPFRRDFCLMRSAAAQFAESAARGTPHLTNLKKQRIRIREVYPSQAASQCRARTLVFPRIAGSPDSRLAPLDNKAALMNLMRHSGALAVLDQAEAARHLERLKLLARQTRAYELQAGRNLKEVPGEVLPALAPYLEGEASLSRATTF